VNAGRRAVRTVRVEAQAKLNLFLRVLSREPSGYHQLETLFQRIALADSVTEHTGGAGRSLDSRGADVGPVERNLAWRAALAFADAAGGPSAFRIEVEKRIPVGGGLGGGSADAAAVLRALNALSERPLDHSALASIAFSLGADVPYLLSTHALAIGSGHGEQLHPLEPLPSCDVLLAVPSFGVSSEDAFRWYAEEHAARRPGTRATLPVGPMPQWKTIASLAANDLEGAVIAHHAEIGALRDALRRGGAFLVQMSGSGSTVFGVFEMPLGGRSFPELDTLGGRAIHTKTLEQVASVELTK
jgi:4-diphosphocytidyl-2-C-methyl-D-erythritol kinase